MEDFLHYKLFEFQKFTMTVGVIVFTTLYIVLSLLVLQIVKRLLYKSKNVDLSKKYSIFTLIKYFFWVFIFVGSLQILGFNLSILLAGSAALLVGLGLGIQKLFSDYISGIIKLVDSTVKVNDIIELNGMVCKVLEIHLRTTKVMTRDFKYIILPNSDLTEHHLINWTYSDITSRFEIHIGVDYSSKVDEVVDILKKAALEHTKVSKTPEPFVRFADFGQSSLEFTLVFMTDEVFRVENIKSEIRFRIFEEFRKNNILIPFPQRVIHFETKEEKPSDDTIRPSDH